MSDKTTEAMTLALEALEIGWSTTHTGKDARELGMKAITILRAALAQEQEQAEPVAWLQPKTVDAHLRPDLGHETCSKADYGAFPVYTAPPHRLSPTA